MSSRDEAGKTKAEVELNLARDAEDNKKGFCMYVGDERTTSKNVGSLLSEMGGLVTQDVGTECFLCFHLY